MRAGEATRDLLFTSSSRRRGRLEAGATNARLSACGPRDLLLLLRVPHPWFLRVGSCRGPSPTRRLKQIPRRRALLLPVRIRPQDSAVRERHPLYDSKWRAVFGGMKFDLHDGAGLQRLPRPFSWRQHARRRRLNVPVFHDALIVGHVEMNLEVGIGPLDLRDGDLWKRAHVGFVVTRGAMVRHNSARGYESHCEKNHRQQAASLHVCTPEFALMGHDSLPPYVKDSLSALEYTSSLFSTPPRCLPPG